MCKVENGALKSRLGLFARIYLQNLVMTTPYNDLHSVHLYVHQYVKVYRMQYKYQFVRKDCEGEREVIVEVCFAYL